ncbi:MAG TPA: iron-sulfur cluster repair di-iron protein [Pyrinomonadaceae bacterium]|nr:iron-sulfur cluster repair di-iron protein [Pyrinomonadaceae bacterium]
MLNINANRTVREIALEIPEATRVFEKLRIDYCCGGSTPLKDACLSAGIEVERLAEMLADATPTTAEEATTPDFQKASMIELMMYILDKHHVYTKSEMVRLESLLEKVLAAHAENHPELARVRQLFQALCDDLKPHMFKEEQILFPYIVELERSKLRKGPRPFAPFGTVNNPIRMMLVEHDNAGELLRELRRATSDYSVPADGCLSFKTLYEAFEAFERDLHQHIHLENNILFPRAVELEVNG